MLRILFPTECDLRSSYSTAFGFSCGGKAPSSGFRNLVALTYELFSIEWGLCICIPEKEFLAFGLADVEVYSAKTDQAVL